MNVRFSTGRFAYMLVFAIALPACADPSRPDASDFAHLEIVSGDDQSGTVGTRLAEPIVARITGWLGTPVPDHPVEFRITSGDGQLVETSTRTDDRGIATAWWVLGPGASAVQTVEARATGDGGDTGPDAHALFTATGRADAPSLISATTTGLRAGEAGTPLPEPVEVRVTDRYGNVRAGITVNWVVKAGGGSVSPASSITDAGGVASTSWILGHAMGSAHRLEALVDPGLVTEIAASVRLPQGASVTRRSGNGQSGSVSSHVATPLEIRLVGAGGAPISGAGVDWSMSASAGQVTPLSPVTDADGRAAARVQLGRSVGSHQVHARVGDLPPVTFAVTATACPGATLSIVQGSGQTGVAGTTLATPLVVRVTDSGGNPIVGAPVTWSGAGSVSPSTAVSNAQGQVSVNWLLGATSGAQTMSAGLGCSSRSFSASVRRRVASVTVTPSPTSIDIGSSVQLSASLRDDNGVVLTGVPVSWSSSSGSTASVSASGLLTGNARGNAAIRATAEGVTGQISVAVVEPVPPREPVASISISPAAPRVKVDASTQLTALPLDSRGELVPDASVSWSSLTPAIATVTQTGAVRGVKVGSATIRATSEGISRNVTVSVTPNGAPGVPVMVEIVAGNQQIGPPGEELFLQLVARVTDSDGNPVGSGFVAWVGDGAPFADVTSTTAQGITRNYWTLGSVVGTQRIELYSYDFGTGTRGVLLGEFTATARP